MDIREAQALAVELMNQHGLTSHGWTFELDEAKRRFGLCSYQRKVISLSRVLIELNTLAQVKDTILHEVAHALAGPMAKHGRLWQVQALAIGARPERCYTSDEVATPTAPWQAVCQFCKRTIKRHRLTRRTAHEAYCTCAQSMAQFPKVYLKWERTQG
jgi:predicted SprT family Zn-dependent metalloprotease